MLSNRKSLEDRNKESQEFYRSDSDDSNNDDKESPSKCDEPENLQREETNVFPESTEAIRLFVEESTESLSTVQSTEFTCIVEKLNGATMVDIESMDAEDTEKATHVVADVNGVDTEISTVVLREDVTKSAMNENGAENQDNAVKAKETIEIDYNFGENERDEIKTLSDRLPHYSTVKPCLKGSVNGVINLDVDDIKPSKSGGDELLERFIKNVAKKTSRSAKEVR